MADIDRAAALARLAELGAAGATTVAAPERTITRTDAEVYAGGEEARLLIRPVHLSYMDKGIRHYPAAKPGDVVLLSEAAAKRLDALGATKPADADEKDVAAALEGEVTDEQIKTAGAADLVAYVTQNPDQRARVRALELERDEKKQRKTVLEATNPEPGTE